jgi:uncharacterized membrane protein SpoIIM required for sporulation
VTPAMFLETRGPVWDRMEAILRKTHGGRLTRLADAEVQELARLYPAVAVDTSRAKMLEVDEATQRRVNQLAIAAHGLLYRRRRAHVAAAVWRFFRADYARLLRRQWGYLALSTAILLTASVGAFASVRLRPSTAYLLVPGTLDMPDDEVGVTARDISERFRQMPNAPMAAGIMTNNITVAFAMFAFGISAGVGTCLALVYNGMMLGGITGHFANHHLTYEFCSFIVPHGVLEIMAILIAAGAGLRLGLSLAIPGGMTRGASLRHGARDAVLMVLGTTPMFVVAGIVEGFVTPSFWPGGLKIAIGVCLGVLAMSYLLLVGRGAPASSSATEEEPLQ